MVLLSRTGNVVQLDVNALLHNRELMMSLFRWNLDRLHVSVTPKSRVPILDAALPPVIVGQPALCDASSSSTAIVPVAAVPAQRELSSESLYTLQYLNYTIGVSREMSVRDIVGVNAASLDELAAQGCLVLRQDEFLETHVRLNPDSLVPSSIAALSGHIPFYRHIDFGKAWGLPKVYYMFRLREDGWQPGNPKDSYKRGDEQLYWQRFDRPLTYFIALYSAERVFHKGVGEIKHNQKDMYYRILLTVKAEAILGLLTDFENKPEEQIGVRIKKTKMMTGRSCQTARASRFQNRIAFH